MNPTPTVSAKSSSYIPSSSLFAQLLASEKIRVRVDENAKTAGFEPNSRELVLPSWKGFESDAWYLFIAHEVGHAKFTPADWMKNPVVAEIQRRHKVTIGQVHSVLNVLEDIRIERLMRREFRGLSGFFSRGYAELVSRDFFRFGTKMEASRWAKYGILDKLNLYGKVGSLCQLTLTDPNHIKWYNQALKMETFEHVLALASDIIDHVKSQKTESTQSHEQAEQAAQKADEAKQKAQEAKKLADEAVKEAKKAQEEADKARAEEAEAKDKAETESKSEDLESKTEEAKEDNLREATEDKTETDNVSESEDGEETETEDADAPEASSDSEEGAESEETTEDGSGEPSQEELPEPEQNGSGSDGAGEDIEEAEESEGSEGESKNSTGTSDDAENETDADSDSEASNGDTDEGEETDSDESSDEGRAGNGPAHDLTDPGRSEDTLTSDTMEAANDQLKEAAAAYQGDSCVILPTDLSYLNEGDINLTEVLEAWQASPELRKAFMEAVGVHRKEAGPILAGMVASFRANQSATQQRKVQISRTGAIDPTRLASYKLTEDIFLRRATTEKGQNHGFVIHVDWSGSMADIMPHVLWQLLHLIWLAETIKVPVEVYAFTTHARGYATPNYSNPINASRAAKGWGAWVPGNNVIALYDSAAPAIVKRTAEAHILSLIYRFSHVTSHLSRAFRYGPKSANLTALDHDRPVYKAYTRAELEAWIGYTLDHKIPVGARSQFDTIMSKVSYNQIITRNEFDNKFCNMGGTPLVHAIMASVKSVRSFRERNRIEQCVSIWLTDGEDSAGLYFEDPTVTDTPSRRLPNANIFYPQTGQTYAITNEQEILPSVFDMHRDATGASVVMIDLSSDPVNAVKKLLTEDEAKSLRGDLAKLDEEGNAYVERYGRRRYGRRSVMTKKAARSTVILKKTKGTFGTDGMMSIDRRQFPSMGADAYIVADPTVFTEESIYANRAAKKSADQASTESSMSNQTLLSISTTIKTQSAAAAMKRFAEIIVPFLADSK